MYWPKDYSPKNFVGLKERSKFLFKVRLHAEDKDKENQQTDFANSNLDIIKFMIEWFKKSIENLENHKKIKEF